MLRAAQPARRVGRRELAAGSRARTSRAASSRAARTCAPPNYCLRYRPAARQGEAVDTSTSHIGFRCIVRGLSRVGRGGRTLSARITPVGEARSPRRGGESLACRPSESERRRCSSSERCSGPRAIFGVWAQRQALNTDNWVATSSRLLENDQIRTALAVTLVDRLYDTDAVAQRLRDELPPRLEPLAAPGANALREVALRNAPRVARHGRGAQGVEGREPPGPSRVPRAGRRQVAPGGEVQARRQGPADDPGRGHGLPAGAVDRLPPSVATVQVLQSDQLKTAQDAVSLFRDGLWVLVILAIASFAGAIALSGDRRHTVATVGDLPDGRRRSRARAAARRRRRRRRRARRRAEAHAVAGDVWNIATSLLVEAAEGSLLFGLLVASGAGWPGPAASRPPRAA